MKLADLGLKTKPETKYFAKGYVSFKTQNKELLYQITFFDQQKNPFLYSKWKPVNDSGHLKDLLTIKSVNEVINQ